MSHTVPSSRLLNVGCGTHRIEGWWNTDRASCCHHHPDQVVTAANPFPFDLGTFDRAYVGHVMEHIPWNDCGEFLDALDAVVLPGAPVMFAGPDVRKCVDLYARGAIPWEDLSASMEHHGGHMPGSDDLGFTHAWNCTEQRLVELLDWAGWGPVVQHAPDLSAWPITAWSDLTQCAVLAHSPGRFT